MKARGWLLLKEGEVWKEGDLAVDGSTNRCLEAETGTFSDEYGGKTLVSSDIQETRSSFERLER